METIYNLLIKNKDTADNINKHSTFAPGFDEHETYFHFELDDLDNQTYERLVKAIEMINKGGCERL